MIPTLKSYILDRWEEMLPDAAKPSDLSFMLQGSQSYRLPYGKVVVLFFRQGDSRPILAAKTPDDPRFGHIVASEYEHLKRMHEWPYPAELKAAIPRPLALQRIGRDTVLIETAVTGESMAMQMLRNRQNECYMRNAFADALAWLTQMRNDEVLCMEGADQAKRVVENALNLYNDLYSPQGEEREALAHAWEIVAPLIGNQLPVVPAQGDFWVDNIFRLGRRVVGVIDWEYARPASIPVWDLFQFEFSMGIAACGKIDLAAIFQTAFFGESSLKREFTSALRNYCAAYGIEFNPRVIEALFVLWIVDTAVKERDLFGRSYETDMLRRRNMLIYLENRRPDWSTFAG